MTKKGIELTQENLGETLRAIRNESGETVIALAERVGANELTIRRAETGKSSPSFELVCKIAAAYGKKIIIK